MLSVVCTVALASLASFYAVVDAPMEASSQSWFAPSFAPTRSRSIEIASLTAYTLQFTDSVDTDVASLPGSRSSPEPTLTLTKSPLR